VSADKPRLAVWKFSSCDGCQLSLLDLEDELLAIAGAVDIAYFLEATSVDLEGVGPFDVSLVEGSVGTPHDVDRIQQVRASSNVLVSIGACATKGGIQALRNIADANEFARIVYPHPEYLSSLETSTAISDHVEVDLELQGCPVSKAQLLEVVTALLSGRRPRIPSYPVCVECKRRGTPCLLVKGQGCLGPVTRAGCNAICPAYARGCFGCFGPAESPNPQALPLPVLSALHEVLHA
jgi:sulfhydrogenase subunit delta